MDDGSKTEAGAPHAGPKEASRDARPSPSESEPPVIAATAGREVALLARATRQEVLAKLGLLALGKADLAKVLAEVVHRIRVTLGVDTCTVLELSPSGEELLVRADEGWGEILAGHHTVSAGRQSQAGYTLLSSEPVVVEDIRTETRFHVAPFIQEQGMRSGMTAIIHGRERPYGIFGVQNKELRVFTKEDVDYFQTAANIVASAVERRRTEEELRRSEESFRSLIEHAPEAILISQDRILCYVNPALVSYLGYGSRDELIGRTAYEIVHPDDRALVAGRLRGIEDTRNPATPRELHFLRRDGTSALAESIGVPIVWDGRPAIAAMIRDIAERRRLEAQLVLNDRLASLGTLAAGVAHEVNNPLTYVLGNLDFMRARVQELRSTLTRGAAQGLAPRDIQASLEDLAGLIEGARDGGEKVRRIVSDLKSVSRGDDDKLTSVDVPKVLRKSIDMVQNQIRHRAQLTEEYGQIPPVIASESRLGQVFLNLLVNAVQAIPEGDAFANRISVSTHTDLQGRAVVEVTDTGSGIPVEIASKLFDPFFTTKPVGVGTGLGLSICHGIVTDLGGQILVDSEVGRGSTFRVSLPPAGNAPAPAAIKKTPPPPRRGRVLLVDDDPLVGKICKRMLESDHDVTVHTEARAVLDHLATNTNYDVIFCDLMMPEMSGMQLFEELRRRHPALAERVVFLSGGTFTPSATAFREQVPNLFLDKPTSATVLKQTVASRLHALEGAGEDPGSPPAN